MRYGGSTEFYGTATAGTATFYNEDSPNQEEGAHTAGNVRFYGSSTAGNATFYNQVGGGTVWFYDSSTAGDGHFFIEDTSTATFYGHVVFSGSSKGGTADITIKENCNSASIEFHNTSNAEQAEITLVNGSLGFVQLINSASMGQANVDIGSTSQLLFREFSTAANSTIRVRPGGSATFSHSSAVADATFNVDGAAVSGGSSGGLYFSGFGAIGNAVVNLGSGAVPGASGGLLEFGGGVNAGNVTVNAAAGVAGAGGGRVTINGSNDASNARITIGDGGNLNVNGFGEASIGSLDVAGSIFLGQAGLRVGGLNTSNIISGPIDAYSGNVNAKLTKVGTGTLTLSGTNSYAGLTTVNAGTVIVNGSNAGGAEVNTGGTLKGSGSFGGPVTVNAGGTFAPGTSPGTITVPQLTMMPGSMLNFELGPTSDLINVTNNGNITLGGTLNVSLLSGFAPVLGQSFPLFSGAIGTISGAFQSIIAPTINGLTFNLNQSAGSVLLQVANASFLAGDYNGNGAVDTADYVVWRDKLGSGTSLLNDDTPGVGQDDHTRWRTNFGRLAGGGSLSNVFVPEPESVLLLILGSAVVSSRRRRLFPSSIDPFARN